MEVFQLKASWKATSLLQARNVRRTVPYTKSLQPLAVNYLIASRHDQTPCKGAVATASPGLRLADGGKGTAESGKGKGPR